MSTRSALSLLLLAALYASLVLAQQDTSIVYPTTAAATATPLPSAHGYTYAGCYNETTRIKNAGGVRALPDMSSANNTMTVSSCLDFCAQGNNGTTMNYAGIEYGRECYCGQYLSALSEEIDAPAHCVYACNGNASEVCGGQLAITLYNLTDASKTGTAWSVVSGQPAWYGFAAFVMLVFAAIL
ncbi:hypothetical protein B0A50_02717 [Salinomyces thailandicus]|uniref:WSC domain-containing protein n=1 Tax=Salinomyces thailandicus TaxID=706561 RepID=A0A4V5N557_9PEZI|nr:hypothetical protein B0A50_02717 [Salinomyces thailandica]